MYPNEDSINQNLLQPRKSLEVLKVVDQKYEMRWRRDFERDEREIETRVGKWNDSSCVQPGWSCRGSTGDKLTRQGKSWGATLLGPWTRPAQDRFHQSIAPGGGLIGGRVCLFKQGKHGREE